MWRKTCFLGLFFLFLFMTATPVLAQLQPTPTPLAGGEIIYEVQAGDTPQSVAAKFGIPLQTLLDLNGLSADSTLRPGQRLLLGFAEDEPEPPAPPQQAEPTNAPVQQPTNPPPQPTVAPIQPTSPPVSIPTAPAYPAPTVLSSPTATPFSVVPIAPPANLSSATPTPQPDGRIVYIVQPGDTLIGIAVRFGYTSEQLQELYEINGMTADSFVFVGQELLLGINRTDVEPIDGFIPPRYAGASYRERDNAFVHRVQDSETLVEIAFLYGYRTMDEFYDVSRLSAESIITTGQEIIVGYKPVPLQQGGSTDLPTATPFPTPTPTDTPTITPTPTSTPLPFPTLAPTETLPPPIELVVTDEGGDSSAESTQLDLLTYAPLGGIIGTILLMGAAGAYWWMRQNRA